MNSITYLKGSEQNTTPLKALSQQITSLIGISQRVAEVLNDVGINTVQDLASSSIFSTATQIDNASCPITKHRSNSQEPILPTDRINPAFLNIPVEHLSNNPIELLSGINKEQAKRIQSELGVATVKDLAKWPPYLSARAILSDAYGLESNSENENDPEAPSDLIPANGKYPTDRVQYEVLLLDEIAGSSGYWSVKG